MIRNIVIVLSLVFGLGQMSQAQFWRKNNDNKEEQLQEKAKGDVAALPVEDHHPYVDKFHKAVREKMTGNYAEAKKLFKECVGIYPHDDAVYFALGEIAMRQKLKSEALEYFQKAQEIDPDNIHYTEQIAYLHLEKTNFEEAVKHLKKLVEHEPRQVNWRYAYGQAQLYARDYEGALETFNKFQDQMGPVPEVTMIKVDLYRTLGKDEKVEEELLLLKKTFPNDLEVLKTVIGYYEEIGEQEKAILLIEELVEQEPENGVAHFILAKNYMEKGNIKSYFESLKVVAKSEEIEIQDKLLLSQSAFELDNSFDTSVYEVTLALAKTHPEEGKLLALHGEALTNLGKSKEALEFYRASVNAEPSEFRLWTNLLAFESAYKEYTALYVDAQEAMALFPSLPFVYFAAAEGAMYLNKLNEAIDFLELGELYIISDDEQSAKYAMRYGEIYFRKDELKKGVDYFEKALELADNNSIKESYAFHLALKDHNLKKAIKIVEDLMNESLNKSSTYYRIGFVFMKNKDWNKAEQTLADGVNSMNYNVELLDLLGDVFIKQGKIDEALESWKKAKTKGSRNTILDKKIEEQKYYAPTYF